jgi:hypothetical protein
MLTKKRVLVLFLLILMVSVIHSNAVNAYQLLGFKWSNPNPVTYYLNGNANTNNAFLSSINNWNNALPSNVSLQRVYNNFNVYAYDWYDSTDGRDGLFVISDGEVYIALNRYHTDNYSSLKRQSVAGHEIGHSLGLDEEDSAICIMISNTFNRWELLQIYKPKTDDINGINALY